MAPRPLSQMIERHVMKNISLLGHVGTLTYAQVAHLLAKVESPAQLRKLEEWSPQLLGDDAELWQKFIARDFPQLARKMNWAPKNPLSWSMVYDKYKRQHERDMREAEAKVAEGFATIQAQVQSRTSKIVDRRLLPGHGGERRRPRNPDPPSLPPRNNLQRLIKKTRGESRGFVQRRTQPVVNGGALTVRPGQIKKAPEAMINDHRIQSQPDLRPAPVRLTPAQPVSSQGEQKAKEARLLAAKQKLASEGVTFVSDSEGEEEDLLRESPVRKAGRAESMESRLLAAKRKRPEPTTAVDSDADDKSLPEMGDLFGDEPPAKKAKPSSVSPAAKPSAAPVAAHNTASPSATRARAPGLLSASYRPPAANPAVRKVTVPKPSSSSSTSANPSAIAASKTLLSSSPSPAKIPPASVPKDSPGRTSRDEPRIRSVTTESGSAGGKEAPRPSSPVLPSASADASPAPHDSRPTSSATAPQLIRKKKRPAGVFMPLNKIAKR